MTQWASQHAGTDQDAEARATGEALAANLAVITQTIRQIQRACVKHCFGIQLSQEAWQSAALGQNGLAVAEGGSGIDAEELAALGLALEGADTLVSGDAIAENLAETLAVLEQIQSDCRRYCYYGESLTDAEWWARTGLVPVEYDPLEELGLFDGEEPEEVLGVPGLEPAGEEVPGEPAAEDPLGEPAGEDASVEEAAGTDAPAEEPGLSVAAIAAESVNDATVDATLEQIQE
jgi:hypothetical protein